MTAALSLLVAGVAANYVDSTDPDASVCTTQNSVAGNTYNGDVSGTFRFRQSDNSYSDAQWKGGQGNTWYSGNLVAWGNSGGLIFINTGQNPTAGSAYNSNHEYSFSVQGDGTPLCFKIGDSWYYDNQGGLTMNVYGNFNSGSGGGGCSEDEIHGRAFELMVFCVVSP